MPDSFKHFKKAVWKHYDASARAHLPWRKNLSAYRVYVSEIMLQQTQVERVIPFFRSWMRAFPTVRALASAPQSEVLRLWKGLGYNSRAIRMRRAAETVVREFGGAFPRAYDDLLSLPGIGPYTAGAICAFAGNQPRIFIETNIRRVYLHHFFRGKQSVHDRDILALVERTVDRERPREWYWALMDYGAFLGRTIPNPNTRSRHYVRQSAFEGSDRQIRGRILEVLLARNGAGSRVLGTSRTTARGKMTVEDLVSALAPVSSDAERVERVLGALQRDGFLAVENGRVSLR